MWSHGDCGTETASAKVASCADQKGVVGIAMLLAGVLAYTVILWKLSRGQRHR